MKIAFILIFAVGLVGIMSGCAEDQTANQGDRIGGRAGVTVGSRDMSRVTPEHASAVPPAS